MEHQPRHTVKISTDALEALRYLAFHLRKRQHAILEELLLTRMRQEEQRRNTPKES